MRRLLARVPPRTLRLVAWSYAIKTLIVALLFLAAPEETERTVAYARAAVLRIIAR